MARRGRRTAALMAPVSAAPGGLPARDALHRRAQAWIGTFGAWCRQFGVAGCIGEYGVRNDEAADNWAHLLETAFAAMADYGLSSFAWAVGGAWGAYNLAPWTGSWDNTIDTRQRQADVIEPMLASDLGGGIFHGANLGGGEFGTDGSVNTSNGTFGSGALGTYGSSYIYETQAGLDYLAARGCRVVRLPMRWERVQPTLGAALDNGELARLDALFGRMVQAGVRCFPEPQNFGAYWQGAGTRYSIGSATVTQDHFADFWRRFATWVGGSATRRAAVAGYDLCNEPVGMDAEGCRVTSVISDLEGGIGSWVTEHGSSSSVAVTTDQAKDGTHALAIANNFTADAFPRIKWDAGVAAGDPALGIWILIPAGTAGDFGAFLYDYANTTFNEEQGRSVHLEVGQWTYVSGAPAGVAGGCAALGFQVNSVGASGSVTFYADRLARGTRGGAQNCEAATQAALTAIRALGDGSLILVPGYQWSSAVQWPTQHPAPWMYDPLGKFMYEAHSYWDNDQSGGYGSSYATELSNAVAGGF